MFYTFPLLIIVVIALIAYFNCRSKSIVQIDKLTEELKKVSDDRDLFEGNYNKLNSDIKKQDELKRSKSLDEIQLLFTKVNMLDDKLTLFNTNIKNRLDLITSSLEEYLAEIRWLGDTLAASLQGQTESNFNEYGEEQQSFPNVENVENTENAENTNMTYGNNAIRNENMSMDDFLNNKNMNFGNNINKVEEEEAKNDTYNLNLQSANESNVLPTSNENVLPTQNKDMGSTNTNEYNAIDNELKSTNAEYSGEYGINDKIEQDINNQMQSFSNDNTLDQSILNKNELYEYKPENEENKVEIKENKIENISEDEELNSALKNLNDMHINIPDNEDLSSDLNVSKVENIGSNNVEDIVEPINPQNISENNKNDLSVNVEPKIDTEPVIDVNANNTNYMPEYIKNDNENLKNNNGSSLNETEASNVINSANHATGFTGNNTIKVNEKLEVNNESGFDIKDSIAKLKAQLDTVNNEDKNN